MSPPCAREFPARALRISAGVLRVARQPVGCPKTDALAAMRSHAPRPKPPECRPRFAAREVRRCSTRQMKKKAKLSALSAEFNTMKAVNKLAVLLSLGALVSTFASAKTDEQSYLESCLKAPGVPVPVAVGSPSVGPEYNGAAVQLEFTVDATGKPADFSVKSSPDTTLAVAVVDAVKQWRFKPAVRDGAPVATKVSLPVKIVDEFVPLNSYASK